MNLNNIVAPIVAAVNPWVTALIQPSQGYTTNDDGKRVPAYGQSIPVQVQMQALQYNDLMQVSGLNIQGERRAMYANGEWDAVVRSTQEGGDLVTLPDGSVWLLVFQFEDWNSTGGWTKFCVTRQNGS
jgi:hypothetical protein